MGAALFDCVESCNLIKCGCLNSIKVPLICIVAVIILLFLLTYYYAVCYIYFPRWVLSCFQYGLVIFFIDILSIYARDTKINYNDYLSFSLFTVCSYYYYYLMYYILFILCLIIFNYLIVATCTQLGKQIFVVYIFQVKCTISYISLFSHCIYLYLLFTILRLHCGLSNVMHFL